MLISLVGFIGHISSKRIIAIEAAKHDAALEGLRSENKKDIALLQAKNEKSLEEVRSELKSEFLKHETYSSISKEIYQELFSKRIAVYEELLMLKNEIEKSFIDNAEYFEIHEDDPNHFSQTVEKINDASQNNIMVISNELAALSSKLHIKSNKVFSNAKVKAFYARINNQDHEYIHEFIIEAEDEALNEMYAECGGIYNKWFTQLEKDMSKIRAVLDLSNGFLDNMH